MSGLLDHITEDFRRRLEVRRAMFGHLGIDVPEDRAADCMTELRETLIACNRCGNPDICEGWVAQGRPGMPMFCRAREAFLRLEVMTAEAADPQPERLRA